MALFKTVLRMACVVMCALTLSPTQPNAADVTIDKGYVSKQPGTKGIVLHLHGCDGLYTEGWVETWIRHFEYSGYRVIAPDSFAEQRPAQSCAYPYPNKWEIYEIRVEQTLRAITEIKQQYPGKPLYVWGHSEGAWLAARVPAATDGVVTTGATCGFAGESKVYFPASVPYVALIGDDKIDHYLRDEFNAKRKTTIAATCTSTDQSPQWRWKSFEGVGHIMPIWDIRVRTEIKPIIDISMTYVGLRGDAETKAFPNFELTGSARTAFTDQYKKGEIHKAFAVGAGGSYGYTMGWGNVVDARIDALVWCNKYARQGCAVYAVDDQVVMGDPDTPAAEPPSTTDRQGAEGGHTGGTPDPTSQQE